MAWPGYRAVEITIPWEIEAAREATDEARQVRGLRHTAQRPDSVLSSEFRMRAEVTSGRRVNIRISVKGSAATTKWWHLIGVGHERDGDAAALGGGYRHPRRPLDLGQQHRKRGRGRLVQPKAPRLHTMRTRPRFSLGSGSRLGQV